MKILHGSRFTRGHPLHWKTFFSSKDGVRATASVALYSSTGKTTVHRHFFVVVQSLSRVQLFATPRTAAHQAPLSSTISQSLLRLTSIELVMLSNHLILCCSFSSVQSFPSLGSFPTSGLFAPGGLRIGASDSASVLPKNIQDWFPLGLVIGAETQHSDVEWFSFETNWDHFWCFWDCTQVLHFRLFFWLWGLTLS